MPDQMVTVVQLCGVCKSEVGTFEVKKENLMLDSKDTIWCPHCQAHNPEVREVAGRHAAIQKERESYPKPGTSANSLASTGT